MNLIERLGGYSMAHAYHESLSDGTTACLIENTIYSKESLGLLLLEYRRQHNIFEVGDKVVFIESELKNPRLMTVIEVSEPICGFLMAECSWGITNGFYPSRYRHATDAEIKAGKRLEGDK
ncbi:MULTISPECIES: hypothetical protein [unclassified Acinetobacter]|uniref:hypothetical protein n=1 Tax=unclassified Acinetobacter TaxID=196816 RepID=UPI0015D364B9|nr:MULTISPECIES: hypothetical protein [unclassified Acinetobacter]